MCSQREILAIEESAKSGPKKKHSTVVGTALREEVIICVCSLISSIWCNLVVLIGLDFV